MFDGQFTQPRWIRNRKEHVRTVKRWPPTAALAVYWFRDIDWWLGLMIGANGANYSFRHLNEWDENRPVTLNYLFDYLIDMYHLSNCLDLVVTAEAEAAWVLS